MASVRSSNCWLSRKRPTIAYGSGRQLGGVEAVIDKDHASGRLARDIRADILILATDTAGAFVGFGTPEQRLIRRASPEALLSGYLSQFAAGSMLPKIIAACDFVRATGNPAVIGALSDIDGMLSSSAGTVVSADAHGIEFEWPAESTDAVIRSGR